MTNYPELSAENNSAGATELKHCPFCGQEPIERAIEAHAHSPAVQALGIPDHEGSHVVECGCGAGLIASTRPEVLAMWNRRAPAAQRDASAAQAVPEQRFMEVPAEDEGNLREPGTDKWHRREGFISGWNMCRREFLRRNRLLVAPQASQPSEQAQPMDISSGHKAQQGASAARAVPEGLHAWIQDAQRLMRATGEYSGWHEMADKGDQLLTSTAAQAVQDEREAFEAWATPKGWNIKRAWADARVYASSAVHRLWEAWQARAALAARPSEQVQQVDRSPNLQSHSVDRSAEMQSQAQQPASAPVDAQECGCCGRSDKCDPDCDAPKGEPPYSLAHEAAQHLTRWLDMYSCECEGPGHECGRAQVKECRDRLLADAPKEEPSDERAAFDRWFRGEKNLNPETDTTLRSDAAEPWKAWKARALLARHSAQAFAQGVQHGFNLVDTVAIRNAALDQAKQAAKKAWADYGYRVPGHLYMLDAIEALKTDQQEQP